MSSFTESVGKRIAELRASRSESQQALADSLGVKRETVKFWESGERQIKAGDIAHIAHHFKVSTDYLMGFTDIMTPDANVQIVCEATGLSEKAVRSLMLWCGTSDEFNSIVDTILSDEESNWVKCLSALHDVSYHLEWLREIMPTYDNLPVYGSKYMNEVHMKLKISRFEAIDFFTRCVDKFSHFWETEEKFDKALSDVQAYEYRRKIAAEEAKAANETGEGDDNA